VTKNGVSNQFDWFGEPLPPKTKYNNKPKINKKEERKDTRKKDKHFKN
jgi:hypothetical protein